MKVGDRWKLQIPGASRPAPLPYTYTATPTHTDHPTPGELAFGKKGRSASPGKPRIPPMATVEYDLKLVALPGREVEMIDLVDFDENAPASDDRCVPACGAVLEGIRRSMRREGCVD